MKKAIGIIFLALVFVISAFAQSGTTAGGPDSSLIGTDTAQQQLVSVSVTPFEDPSYFYASMPGDQGVVTLRGFPGGPAERAEIAGDNALGIKVEFYRRGVNQFMIIPVRPIPIEGVAKTISVWVVGRNYNHRLVLLLEDFFGNRIEVPASRPLNFSGWEQVVFTIPPNIRQTDFHYTSEMGVSFAGFRVDCAIAETYGTYFIYFDDLQAETDLFIATNRDADDMPDNW